MTNLSEVSPVIVECGTEIYHIERVRCSGANRAWRIFRVVDVAPHLVPCPEAFPLIVQASGADLVFHSQTDFEWQLKETGDRFWASLSESSVWLIESCEGGGTHWYECDLFAIELALGLRVPSGLRNVQERRGPALRVIEGHPPLHRSPVAAPPLVGTTPLPIVVIEAWRLGAHC